MSDTVTKQLSRAGTQIHVRTFRRIQTSRTGLRQGRSPFCFFGTNAYYLLEVTALGVLGSSARARQQVMDFFQMASRSGMKVVRTWGFNEDPAKPTTTLTQTRGQSGAPIRRVDEIRFGQGLDALDYVIRQAQRFGIYLIIPLVNYWHDYGGISQYARWVGYHTTRANGDPDHIVEELFYLGTRNGRLVSPNPKDIYKRYVQQVVGRFCQHPNILAWELMNEPRARALGISSNRSARRRVLLDGLRAWIGEMARFIKQQCDQQLVSIGGAPLRGQPGHELDDMTFIFNSAAVRQQIDLVDTHLYPNDHRPPYSPHRAMAILRAAARSARSTWQKPFYLGEFGIRPSISGFTRHSNYGQWSTLLRNQGASGMLFWQLLPGSRTAFDPFEMHVAAVQTSQLTGVGGNRASRAQPAPGDLPQLVTFANQALTQWQTC